jgi:hypothetical protein
MKAPPGIRRLAGLTPLTPDDVHYHLAPVRDAAVLEQVDAL